MISISRWRYSAKEWELACELACEEALEFKQNKRSDMNYFYLGLGIYYRCEDGKGNTTKEALEKHLGYLVE